MMFRVNDIGGGVEFANFATTGIQQIEVLREPNSALYGSDALAGVISMTTARGTTKLPLFTYAGDGGNFSTYHQEVTASGVARQFDYYGAFGRLDSRNNLPNDSFHKRDLYQQLRLGPKPGKRSPFHSASSFCFWRAAQRDSAVWHCGQCCPEGAKHVLQRCLE